MPPEETIHGLTSSLRSMLICEEFLFTRTQIELIAQHHYLQTANSSLCPPELQSSPLQLPQYTPQQYSSAGFGVAPNGSYPAFYAAQHSARHSQQTGPPTGLPRTGAPSGSGIEILRDTAGKKGSKRKRRAPDHISNTANFAKYDHGCIRGTSDSNASAQQQSSPHLGSGNEPYCSSEIGPQHSTPQQEAAGGMQGTSGGIDLSTNILHNLEQAVMSGLLFFHTAKEAKRACHTRTEPLPKVETATNLGFGRWLVLGHSEDFHFNLHKSGQTAPLGDEIWSKDAGMYPHTQVWNVTRLR